MPITEPIVRVTARDMQLGDEVVKDLRPGQFVVVCAEPMHVVHDQRYDDGTVLITLKRRDQDASDIGPKLCCDLHNQHCEPPSELCCQACTEAGHPKHPAGVRCVLDTGSNPAGGAS